MSEPSEISRLSKVISSQVDTIDQYLEQNNIPRTSFDIDSPLALRLPPDLEKCRDAAFDAMDQLQTLLLGPIPCLVRRASPTISIIPSLRFVYRFNVAHNLKVGETVSYDELATRCNVDGSDLRRMLRSAIAHYIFCEPDKGFVSHNSLSKALRDVPGFRDWIGLVSEEIWPSALPTIDAMEKWPKSQDINHSGFVLMNKTDETFFEAIGNNPQRTERFANGMTFAQSSAAMSLSFLLDNLDWSGENCPTSVVDIGGSRGGVGIQLLNKFPRIESFTVQERPEVIQDAKAPEGLENRLHFMEHDFFAKQTLEGQQAYFFRHILHDWPDQEAIRILKNLVPALQPGARIYLNESCLPDPGLIPKCREQFTRGYDLCMKYINNGKERDRDDWESLVPQVDEKLRIKSIVSPPGSMLSIIELIWDQ